MQSKWTRWISGKNAKGNLKITQAMKLFKAFLTQSDTTDTWRETLVSALFKGGKTDRNKAENSL